MAPLAPSTKKRAKLNGSVADQTADQSALAALELAADQAVQAKTELAAEEDTAPSAIAADHAVDAKTELAAEEDIN